MVVRGVNTDLGDPVDGMPETYAPMFLEIVKSRGERQSLKFPVRMKSLSSGGGILEGFNHPGDLDIEALAGRQAIIHFPPDGYAELPEVRASVLWARAAGDERPDILLGVELKESSPRVKKFLQDLLPVRPRDIQGLWEQWDQFHEDQRSLKSDQVFYLVGSLAVLCGLVLYFLGPDSSKLYGSIAAIYGSLVIGGKSLWTMWRRRASSRN